MPSTATTVVITVAVIVIALPLLQMALFTVFALAVGTPVKK